MSDLNATAFGPPVYNDKHSPAVRATDTKALNTTMSLEWLDHVAIRTANLTAMIQFYQQVLGLRPGPRPPFRFNGSWLYCGERAAVHLVETPVPPAGREPRIEHLAFRAQGLPQLLNQLRAHGVEYRVAIVPDLGLRQVHISDPDGNHVEVTFAPQEQME
ncbi:MAG: VOC family protein [Acidiferrobacterales bacterium]